MLRIRTRKYRYFVLKHDSRRQILDWKKKPDLGFPWDVYQLAAEMINTYFHHMDILTVPAPSFHSYENYPIWEIAKTISTDCGIKLEKLFPAKSGRTRMGWHGSLQKQVQEISLEPGKYVLVLDDIFTTGHTLRVTCEAIINCIS